MTHATIDSGDSTLPTSARLSLKSRPAAFWTRALFAAVRRVPGWVEWVTPFVSWATWHVSPSLRANLLANARRLLGDSSTKAQRARYGRRLIRNNMYFMVNMGRGASRTLDQLFDFIEVVDGQDHYEQARADQKGLIVATAHLGSYEVGMAALRQKEQDVHVVFQRDPVAGFEDLRHSLHQKLGIHEVPVDDGMETWVRLRDALEANQVIVMQADRIMPGQRGQPIPFFDGSLEMPLGPMKMARLTGAPILPIFAIDQGAGKVRVVINAPIRVEEDGSNADGAMEQLARSIEQLVRAYPDQWLVLEKAWCEDRS